MLSKVITRSFPLRGLLSRPSLKFNFGSDHHDHHDYSVHIDKNATWIKYKTNRNLACVEGIIDNHYQLKNPDTSDPWVHLKQNSALSVQNLIYNDAYYHEDDHQPFVNEPHGYAVGSDPIDTRFDTVVPNVLAMSSIAGLLLLILFLEQNPSSQGRIYRQKIAYEYVEGHLEKKNAQLNDIKDHIKQLSAQ